MRKMMRPVLLALLFITMPAFADDAANTKADINAVTADGNKVVLHADGHWEYAASGAEDKQASKAVAPSPSTVQEQETTNAAANTTNTTTANAPVSAKNGCPPGWQGGAFGVGRCIPPGDKDFNRGSLRSK